MSANKKFTGIASDLYKEQTKIIQSQRNQIKELQEQNTHLTQRMEYLEEINTEYKELKSAADEKFFKDCQHGMHGKGLVSNYVCS
jgi:gas vesicle protein